MTGSDVRADRKSDHAMPWQDVLLTPLDETDLDRLQEWQNAPGIRDLTMGFRFPVQKESVREWLRGIREQNSVSRIVFAIRLKSDLVGTVSLHGIDTYQRKASLGIFVGSQAQRSRGIGFVSTCLMADYAFNGLDFRRIGLDVMAENHGAIALYERVGFQREGTKREDYFVDGRYVDTHVYGLLKRDFTVEIPAQANRLLHRL